MRLKKDNIHYDFRHVDRYNKAFNFVISARELGKSTAIWWKVYLWAYHKHSPAIVLRRMTVDITEAYVDSIAKMINKFLPENKRFNLYYKKKAIDEGVCDVFMDKKCTRQLCRLVALNVPKSRMKSLAIDKPSFIIFDEFIIDTMQGEKYLNGELDRFRELYNTYNRFRVETIGKPIKCYFLGNPYTIFSPYVLWLNVPLNEIKEGNILIGSNWYFECAKLSEELKAFILEHNPLYEFDDSYKRYAFGAQAINDDRFIVNPKRPDNYTLRFIFKVQQRYVYIWQKNSNIAFDLHHSKFWVETSDSLITTNKPIYAIDFENLTEGTTLWLPELKACIMLLRYAIARRDVTYKSIEAGYYIQEIYKIIK